MSAGIEYTRGERFALWAVGAFGFIAVNGAFVYGLVADPGALGAALANPISVAFIAEAMVLMGLFAYLLGRWGAARLSWKWFVGLSLVGSMAFALPIVLLYRARRPGVEREQAV